MQGEYLNGRSEKFIANYEARDMDHKYLSIMAWKRRQKEAPANREDAGSELLKSLRRLRKALENGVVLNENEIKKVGKELNYMREALTNYNDIQRQRAIEALERESQRIAEKLAALRGE